MKLKDIMTTPVVTIIAKAAVWQAAAAMEERGCGFLPVIENGVLVGVVTGRDLATRIGARRVSFESVPVSAVMTSPALGLNFEMDSEDAVILMRSQDVHRLVITEANGRVAGIVSLADLAGIAPDASITKTLQRHAERSLPIQSYPLHGLFLG